ncbi:hypothetical protein [Methanolobus psychrotolerans]|uniref:hypothetical protein n=1 Tax=Methanolobus psychrotolerans TaxID=1874706 RepID=UPI000B918139|nr:hypothetical protein [Methanolobus psychrotolerans]
MARELSPKDIDVLKKVAPECAGLECAGSKAPYKSILPPLSNHYAKSEDDFKSRISALNGDDLEYLLSLIRTGEESLGCVPPHYMTIFLELISERMGKENAEEIMTIYMKWHEC